MFDYPVILTKDDDSILVTFPDIPEAITFGENEQEALRHGVDALESALSFYVDDKKPLPTPSKIEGLKTLRPSSLECVKLALYVEMQKQGIKKAELARRLNCHALQIDRLLDLTHASKFEQLEKALHSLGRRIEIAIF